MKLFLARHAETNFNIKQLANSDAHVDVHLTENGVSQARNIAELLKDATFEIIFISELPRTRQTADIINLYHNKELIVDRRINDIKTGFESQPVADWLAALDTSENRWDAKFNDGESLHEAAARGRHFIKYLKHQSYESVLVVTHGFMTQVISGYIENKPIEEAAQSYPLQGNYTEFNI